ncbi:ferritin-like domain-containing protein [Lacticaseibacillus yichunensis]|uniref:Ferritin-like domain-containing protein n=1 Tax=Lacticaseibacillus yichunensis TaxID=2486015 RepID=A0ABW4CPA9_9LACO|nr:ferritin-like domain-containing protein [Lacticaseibacillus yichunensis]
MTIEERYQASVAQADLDHHKPTAGAMTSHIVANLWVLDVKFHQARWFVSGPQTASLQALYQTLIDMVREQLDRLGDLLLDENELPPATTAEIAAYGKIDEEPRLMFSPAETIVDVSAHDLTMANLFIDRAIKLAQREDRPAMAVALTTVRGENNHAIRQLQAILGKTAWEGLRDEDEDDED